MAQTVTISAFSKMLISFTSSNIAVVGEQWQFVPGSFAKTRHLTPSSLVPDHIKIPSIPRRIPSGFTLVELLVVVVLIAILMALLIPVGTKVMKSSERASGQAALKNIGGALTLYAADYGMALPSITQGTEFVVKQKRGPGNDLMYHLAVYLNGDTLAATNYVPGTAGKAFLRRANPLNVACYQVSPYVRLADGTGMNNPFGYRAVGSAPATPGIKLSRIANPSQQVALIDLDSELRSIDGVKAGISPVYVPTPLYGDRRLALYFDWHVEAIPVGTNHYSDKRW